jgi:glycosyltransferase involved in cell wall biosynthesis
MPCLCALLEEGMALMDNCTHCIAALDVATLTRVGEWIVCDDCSKDATDGK